MESPENKEGPKAFPEARVDQVAPAFQAAAFQAFFPSDLEVREAFRVVRVVRVVREAFRVDRVVREALARPEWDRNEKS